MQPALLVLSLLSAQLFAGSRARPAPGAKIPALPSVALPAPAAALTASFAAIKAGPPSPDLTKAAAALSPAGAAVRGRRVTEQKPDDTGAYKGKAGKKRALKELEGELEKISELQRRLAAERKAGVLIVLQGMDGSGKDGTVRHVLGSVDPQGLQVRGYKKPTEEEAAHDFLWRIHPWVPKKGMIGVFNRSHYEDILVPGVEKLIPEKAISQRIEQVNSFERFLVENGVLVLKFFLNISKAEQKERLEARLEDPAKHWKFDPNDLRVRAQWERYQAMYRRVLKETDKARAPWLAVPSDKKWYRNLMIARMLRRALEAIDPRYPPAPEGLDKVRVPD